MQEAETADAMHVTQLDPEPANPGDEEALDESPARHLPTKKRKGKSTRWNIPAHALQILEQVFQKDKFPTVETRKNLSADLKVTPRQVQVWFQNKRQRSVKPPSKSNSDLEQHEILNTSEDIRAALMNFGNGTVEPTRPQNEVFANDDQVTSLGSVTPMTSAGSSSAAAEAWMAAAMRATQMQFNGPQPAIDPSIGRTGSDAGLSNWWRSSHDGSQPSSMLHSNHLTGFGTGYPPLQYQASSSSAGQWQLAMQQSACPSGGADQSRYVQTMQLPQMMQLLSRAPTAPAFCDVPVSRPVGAGDTMFQLGKDNEHTATPPSGQSVNSTLQDSSGAGITRSRGANAGFDEASAPSLSQRGIMDDAAVDASLDNMKGLSGHQRGRLRLQSEHENSEGLSSMPSASLRVDNSSAVVAQQWQHMLAMEHRSRHWSQLENAVAVANDPCGRGLNQETANWPRCKQDAKQFYFASALPVPFLPHASACQVQTSASPRMDMEPEEMKSDPMLMRDMAEDKNSQQQGDEFMDQIIESLIDEELTAIQQEQDSHMHPELSQLQKTTQAKLAPPPQPHLAQQLHLADHHQRLTQLFPHMQRAHPLEYQQHNFLVHDQHLEPSRVDHHGLPQHPHKGNPQHTSQHAQHRYEPLFSQSHQPTPEQPSSSSPRLQSAQQSRQAHEPSYTPTLRQMQEMQKQMHQQIKQQQQQRLKMQQQAHDKKVDDGGRETSLECGLPGSGSMRLQPTHEQRQITQTLEQSRAFEEPPQNASNGTNDGFEAGEDGSSCFELLDDAASSPSLSSNSLSECRLNESDILQLGDEFLK